MESTDHSAQEKLDQLLRDGKITEDEYLRLSRALEKEPDRQEEQEAKAAGGRRLTKSWNHRRIGGVCGGFADYFQIDPVIVRIIAIVLLCMAPPVVSGLYLGIYFMLPWDDEEAEKELERRGPPRWLAQLSLLFSTVRTKFPSSTGHFKNLPWQVWLIIVVLAMSSVFSFPILIGKYPLRAFGIVIVSGLLIYGLYRSQWWAFFVSLFFCFGSIVAINRNPIGALFSVALGVVLLTAYPHFFPRKQNSGLMDKEC